MTEAPSTQSNVGGSAPTYGRNVTPRCLLNGLDSLYACYNVDLATSSLDFPELEYRKQLAADRDKGRAAVEIEREPFQVEAYGSFPYRYVLQSRDFKFSIAEHMSPSLKVQFYSEALWRDGAQALHDRVMAWVDALDAYHLRKEKISRADWAFDFDLAVIDFNEDDFVSRARKNNKWRDRRTVQTFTLGTGDIVVRVYDKIAEIENASEKAWFYDLWGQCENVWRVEFQVRGPRLKAGGIETFEQLENFQADLLGDLASSHTTLRRPNGDTNRAR